MTQDAVFFPNFNILPNRNVVRTKKIINQVTYWEGRRNFVQFDVQLNSPNPLLKNLKALSREN